MAIFKILDGKKGVIQSKVIGGRYDWCSRNIITPNSGDLRADEIDLPYVAGLELLRFEIENLYCKMMNVNAATANNEWKKAKTRYNPLFAAIMDKIIKTDRIFLTLLLNRSIFGLRRI